MFELEPYRAYLTEEPHIWPRGGTQLSVEDRAAIDSLSADDLGEWAAVRIEECTRRLRALNSVHNSLVPIHRKLPPEILMEIFANATSRRFFDLLHVCRTWRSLIIRTPAYWVAVIDTEVDLAIGSEYSIAQAELLLTLSRTAPLTLQLGGLPDFALQRIAPHVNRIRQLGVEVNGTEYKALARLLSSGMSQLEDLMITHKCENTNVEDYQDALISNVSGLPRLRSLSLPASIAALSGLAGQLRELTMFACFCGTCIKTSAMRSVHHLLEALRGFSHLEHLRFGCDTFSYDPSFETQEDSITLPALRMLRLTRVGDASIPVVALLTRITVAKLCTVYIEDRTASNLRTTLPEHDLRTFLPVALADSLEFEFSPKEQGILKTYSGRTMLLRTSASGSERQQMKLQDGFASFAAELSEMFSPFSNITKLTLRTPPAFISATVADRAALRTLLHTLPLVRLDTTAYNGTSDIVSLLGETAGGNCLCPHLQDLAVHFRWRFFELDMYNYPYKYGFLDSLEYDGDSPYANPRTGPEALEALCDGVAQVLERRGSARLLRTLHVAVHTATSEEKDSAEVAERWAESAMKERERLQTRVGHLVGRITVEYES